MQFLVSIKTRINSVSIYTNQANIRQAFAIKIFWAFWSSAMKIGHFCKFAKGAPKSVILSALRKIAIPQLMYDFSCAFMKAPQL